MIFPGDERRIKDLEDTINQILEIVKDYQEEISLQSDPLIKRRYKRELQRQKSLLSEYQKEWAELKQNMEQVTEQTKRIEDVIQQVDSKLNRLLAGQDDIKLKLLTYYDNNEKIIIETITQGFEEIQIRLTQDLLMGIEKNQISEPEMKEMLAVIEEKMSALPPSTTEPVTNIIKSSQFDIKHQLKVTVPIIPLLVNYEAEIDVDNQINFKVLWEYCMNKLRGK